MEEVLPDKGERHRFVMLAPDGLASFAVAATCPEAAATLAESLGPRTGLWERPPQLALPHGWYCIGVNNAAYEPFRSIVDFSGYHRPSAIEAQGDNTVAQACKGQQRLPGIIPSNGAKKISRTA